MVSCLRVSKSVTVNCYHYILIIVRFVEFLLQPFLLTIFSLSLLEVSNSVTINHHDKIKAGMGLEMGVDIFQLFTHICKVFPKQIMFLCKCVTCDVSFSLQKVF